MKKTLKKALSEVVNKHLSQIFDEPGYEAKKILFFLLPHPDSRAKPYLLETP